MKMFRASFAAIFGAVALATTVEQPSTESPLAAAEHARDSALEHANQTLHSVMRKAQELRHRADDEDAVDQEVTTIEAAFPNTTHHYSRQRKHMMHEHQHAGKQAVDEEVDIAKAAANAYKHAARVLETQRRHAGLPESVYEGGFDHDEGLSEGWHDEAENYGDSAENHIEAFFDKVEDKIERHVDQQRDQQRDHEEHEESDFDDQDREDDREDDHEDDHEDHHEDHHEDQQDDHQDDHRDDQQDHAPAPAPASASAAPAPAVVIINDRNQPDVAINNTDQQSTRVVIDNSDQRSTAVDVASTALNLRAVAQNPRSDGQGFLLTFACIGFLASMAFAVQMQRRPTRSQATEPLLSA